MDTSRIKRQGRKAAEAALDFIQDTARDGWARFKAQNAYTKRREAVIGGWLALSLLTLFVFSPCSGVKNEIGAVVLVGQTQLGGIRTFVQVTNESNDDWGEITLTLDGKWVSHSSLVIPHDKPVFWMRDFVAVATDPPAPADAVRTPPQDYFPRFIEIRCSEGIYSGPAGRPR
jgi:hypothetical protein